MENNKTKKIGLLLGSFDPPHIGHVWAANYALNTGLDVVWVIPAWVNPWKIDQTPFVQRVEMCKRTFDNNEHTIITQSLDGEYKSHYTYEGLEKLLATTQYNADFYIIGGTDIASQVSKWKNGEWILQNFKVIEVPRVGYTTTPIGIECSSTAIKEMIKNGKSTVPFLNDDTIQYIKNNKLYC